MNLFIFLIRLFIFLSLTNSSLAMEFLHPKIDERIPCEGNLIKKNRWPTLARLATLGTKFYTKNSKGFDIPVIKTPSGSCYAIHPGELLGEGKCGQAKLAQLIHVDEEMDLPKGSFVAIKSQCGDFDENEIEAATRVKLLVDGPFKYYKKSLKKEQKRAYAEIVCEEIDEMCVDSNADFVNSILTEGLDDCLLDKSPENIRYAYVMKLIHGDHLDDWLKKIDRKKGWNAQLFLKLASQMGDVMKEQVHKKRIAYNDSNLENFIIDEKGYLVIVDFGNAITFEEEDMLENEKRTAFLEYCAHDILMIYASIFSYLAANNYPDAVQNEFWREMYVLAFNAYQKYIFLHEQAIIANKESAYDIIYSITYVLPPFLQTIDNEKNNTLLTDKEVIDAIMKYWPTDFQ